MSRIDPSVAGRISRMILQAEVAKLVSEIATEQRVQLNEAEESTIAAELTDDMVGLGPVEPFLDDDGVTDILVNGPFDIYVERRGKLEKTNARFRDAQHLVNIAQRIAVPSGGASTRRAQWSTRDLPMVAASTSYCRRSCSMAAPSRSVNSQSAT
jgi:pilus assembly protein CpaF